MEKKELYKNKWLSLYELKDPENGVGGYVYSHETRCEGKIIAFMPFRKREGKLEVLLRNEVTPCWGMHSVLSSFTGGYEGGDPRDTTIIELKEEAGYTVHVDELIFLGNSYASKSSDTQYYLYGIDVSDKEEGEAVGDGSSLEKKAFNQWVTEVESDDPQATLLYHRLKKYLSKTFFIPI